MTSTASSKKADKPTPEAADGARSRDAKKSPKARTSAPQPAPAPGAAQSDIASFVLRFTQDLWRDAAGEPQLRWRGHIRHVQSDADARFVDFADAVAFMRAQLARLTEASVSDATEADRESVMQASLEIWERFAQTSAEVLAEALKASVDRGENLGREAYDLWSKGLEFWKPLTGAWGLGGSSSVGASEDEADPAPSGEQAAAGAAPVGATGDVGGASGADRAAILESMAAMQRQLDALAESLARLDAEDEGG
jgi:hypothetical protein